MPTWHQRVLLKSLILPLLIALICLPCLASGTKDKDTCDPISIELVDSVIQDVIQPLINVIQPLIKEKIGEVQTNAKRLMVAQIVLEAGRISQDDFDNFVREIQAEDSDIKKMAEDYKAAFVISWNTWIATLIAEGTTELIEEEWLKEDGYRRFILDKLKEGDNRSIPLPNGDSIPVRAFTNAKLCKAVLDLPPKELELRLDSLGQLGIEVRKSPDLLAFEPRELGEMLVKAVALQTQVEEFRNELQAVRSQLQQKEGELTITRQQNRDLERQVSALQNEVTRLNKEIGRLQAQRRSALPWMLVAILGLLTIAMAGSLWARRT